MLSVVGILAALGHAAPLSLEELELRAIEHNASIGRAQARVELARARRSEVAALKSAKLQVTTWVAPMFTVEGSALEPGVRRDYSLDAWGPSTHADGTLVQPLSTFGRVKAGRDAADALTGVAQEGVREQTLQVLQEVRQRYTQWLLAGAFVARLDKGLGIVGDASGVADERYAEGTGEVTQVDRMRLAYADAELRRLKRVAEAGQAAARLALQHLVGHAEGMGVFDLEEVALPRRPANDVASLEAYTDLAQSCRPEVRQLALGEKAASSAERAERRSMAPVLFAAARFQADWSPTRDHLDNPYHYDPYNGSSAGAAVGLRFDLDPAKSKAKARQAEARALEVDALGREAATGIPVQVRLAHADVRLQGDVLGHAADAAKATAKWVASAATGFGAGTGEAKELLEGVAADLQAQRAYLEARAALQMARARLDWAAGVDALEPACTRPE